jgi:hypothetical protein
MRRVLSLLACAGALVLAASAASAAARDRLGFVTAPAGIKRTCTATAKFVGYAVPCPLEIPRGLFSEGGDDRCGGGVVFAPFRRAATCEGARGWRGWVAGMSATPGGAHLALTASPRVEPDIAKLVNGPAWYPGARVRFLGRSRVRSWLVRWAFVPATTNDGSQFSEAVVATWSTGGHSYAIGFRAAGDLATAKALDERLLEGLALVG